MSVRLLLPLCAALAGFVFRPAAFSALRPGAEQAGTYLTTDFGARGDGKTVNTGSIQAAVNDCHAHGGGTVLVPPGVFVTGTVRLLSNVHLELLAGAVLQGSTDLADYFLDGVKEGIIFADDAENISISGPGCIDGIGSHFHIPGKPHPSSGEKKYTRQGEDYMNPRFGTGDGPIAYDDRPGMMVVVLRCSRVSINDLLLRDSPMYAVRIGNCDNVTIAGITVQNNPLIPNNDGIHCTTSRNVHIADCHIESGDDAIIVTGFPYGIYGEGTGTVKPGKATFGNTTNRAENITVTNCTLSSRSAGIRVGYGDNDIRNCVFQNIVIVSSNRGIGVFARDAGSIDNIIFSNIIIETRLFTGGWWGAGEPIHVSAIPQSAGITVGTISRITFSNIIAESEAGIVLYGVEASPLKEVILDNVRLTVRDGPLVSSYGGNFDLRPALRPEDQIFRHDIPGVYARYLLNSRLEHVYLSWQGNLPAFYTHGMEMENSKRVVITDFHGTPGPNAAGAKRIAILQCEEVKTE